MDKYYPEHHILKIHSTIIEIITFKNSWLINTTVKCIKIKISSHC